VLTFDEKAHRYFWHGQPVPNVTRVLAPWTDYSHIPPATLERAQQEGKAVHFYVEQDCIGLAHKFGWPDWMAGHIKAWGRFKEETSFQCWFAERKLYNRKMGYAGTADLFGELPSVGPVCIDVKRSFYAGPIIGLQTAAYTDSHNGDAPKDMRVPSENRFALRLDADGKYRLQRFPDPDDWMDFVAALRQHRFREKHYVSRPPI
jgi:hypothetical protein